MEAADAGARAALRQILRVLPGANKWGFTGLASPARKNNENYLRRFFDDACFFFFSPANLCRGLSSTGIVVVIIVVTLLSALLEGVVVVHLPLGAASSSVTLSRNANARSSSTSAFGSRRPNKCSNR